MKRVVAGPRAVSEALASSAGAIAVVYLEEGGARGALREIAEAAKRKQVRTEERTREELDALAGGVRHQGAIAIGGDYPYVEMETLLSEAASPPLLVALDEVTDPHNFGAIIRSAVAFGADGVITLRERSAPVTPVVVRASAGATERTRIARVTNLTRALESLREMGMQAVGLAVEGSLTLADL